MEELLKHVKQMQQGLQGIADVLPATIEKMKKENPEGAAMIERTMKEKNFDKHMKELNRLLNIRK